MRTLAAEIRHALRVLRRNRTATLVSLLTLTLAIGATTAIFTVADGLLLRRLPYPEPDRLVNLARQFRDGVADSMYIPMLVRLEELRGGPFSEIAAYIASAAGSTWSAADRPIASSARASPPASSGRRG